MNLVHTKFRAQSEARLSTQGAVELRNADDRNVANPTETPVKNPHEKRRFVAHLHHSFDPILRIWRTLEREGACTAFQQFAWAALIRDYIVPSAGAGLFAIEVTDALTKRTIMLLPLLRIQRRMHSIITGLDLGVSDYTAPLLAQGLLLSRDEAQAVWAAISKVLPKSDLIHLGCIPPQVFGSVNPLVSIPTCRRMEMQAFGVGVDGDPETLLQRLCRQSTFRDFAKFRRRLERRGKICLVSPSTRDEVDSVFNVLVEQRRHRFREIRRFDLLANDNFVAFYRAAAHQGLTGGPARIFGLTVDGQCIATAYGVVYRDAFHLLIQTMDGGEQWRNCSPGLQVTADVMKWSLLQNLKYFDFTIGMLPYKLEFGAAPSSLFEICEARSIRGNMILCWDRATARAKAWLQHYPRVFSAVRATRRVLDRLRAKRDRNEKG